MLLVQVSQIFGGSFDNNCADQVHDVICIKFSLQYLEHTTHSLNSRLLLLCLSS
jgi:hypothetical protein